MQYLTFIKSFIHAISPCEVDFTTSILKRTQLSFRKQLTCLQFINAGSRTEKSQVLGLLVYHPGPRPTQQQLLEGCVESIISYVLNETLVINLQSKGRAFSFSYLSHHGLLILLLLGHFDWRQFCHSRHQEIHENVLTVGQLVHHVLQAGWQIMRVQVVIISVETKERVSRGPSLYNDRCSSLTENTYLHFESLNTSWMMMMTMITTMELNYMLDDVLKCFTSASPNVPYEESTI